jgi:hypothetical protein
MDHELEQRLASAEAVVNQVKHLSGPAGELAWHHYHTYMRMKEPENPL